MVGALVSVCGVAALTRSSNPRPTAGTQQEAAELSLLFTHAERVVEVYLSLTAGGAQQEFVCVCVCACV